MAAAFADAGTVVNTLVNNGTSNYTNAYTGDAVAASPSTNTLAPELKTFYDTELLENARTEMFYAQFGRKQRLPKTAALLLSGESSTPLPAQVSSRRA